MKTYAGLSSKAHSVHVLLRRVLFCLLVFRLAGGGLLHPMLQRCVGFELQSNMSVLQRGGLRPRQRDLHLLAWLERRVLRRPVSREFLPLVAPEKLSLKHVCWKKKIQVCIKMNVAAYEHALAQY